MYPFGCHFFWQLGGHLDYSNTLPTVHTETQNEAHYSCVGHHPQSDTKNPENVRLS